MKSHIKIDDINYNFEYSESYYYWHYSSTVEYKYKVDSNSLQDLAFTFHSHVNHWESIESNQEKEKFISIIEYLSNESNHPFELEENSLTQIGLSGIIHSISSNEIIIKLSLGELHIDLTTDNYLKNILQEYFEDNELEIMEGQEIHLDDNDDGDLYLFITTEQRVKEITRYLEKLNKLNKIYQQCGFKKTIKIN